MSYFITILAGIIFGVIIQHAAPGTYTHLSKLWTWLTNAIKALANKIRKKSK